MLINKVQVQTTPSNCGDFNIPGLKWTCKTNDVRLISALSGVFYHYWCKTGLWQIVTKPTRGSSALDLVFVTSDNVDETCVGVNLGEIFIGCDHCTVTVVFPVLFRSTSPGPFKNFYCAEYGKIEGLFVDINWEAQYLQMDG